MGIEEEISEAQRFSERTIKYGRNTLAASLPILIFSIGNAVDLKDAKPFNMDIQNVALVWCFLLTVLIYYTSRFYALAVPDLWYWETSYGYKLDDYKSNIHSIATDMGENVRQLMSNEGMLEGNMDLNSINTIELRIVSFTANIESNNKSISSAQASIKKLLWERRHFWIADVALPGSFAAVAFVAALWNIWTLYFALAWKILLYLI